MKVFLSHSSHDNDIVHAVASHVGRIFVTLDVAAFHTPDDLIELIERAVQEAAIFVYFASRTSMQSIWVNFELNEARYHQSLNRLRKVVVVLLDDGLGPTDFPEWMRRFIFMKSHAARPIARVIRTVIDDMVADEQSGFFVGRASETTSLQAAFVPPDTSRDTAVVIVRGLPGIGRRTLVQRIARDSLSLDRLLTVRVEIGDNANSIAAKLADLVAPVVTADETLDLIRQIQALELSSACSRFASDVKQAIQLHELVVLYDEGGVLNDDGSLTIAIQSLLSEVTRTTDTLVALVTNRRPKLDDIEMFQAQPIIDVGPLKEAEVRQLIALKARSKDLKLTTAAISSLAEQAKGYPPAVTALISLAEVYGPDLVARHVGTDTQYQPRPLTRYLADLSLSPAERKMVSILARNSPLPLSVLELFAADHSEAALALANLIDASLVMPQLGTSWYRISDPIIDYVDRHFSPCTMDDYLTVADALDGFLGEDRDAGAYLDLSRVLYRALIHAGKERRSRAYALEADWLRLAAEFYHQRNYPKALELATIAYGETPSAEALSWIIRANVKLGDFEEALTRIGMLHALGQSREAHFLRGFLERNRGDYKTAIQHYELAHRAGRGGLALERDLAECYFQIGDLDRAVRHVEAAQARQSDNPYVLNLRVKIACRQLDEQAARRLLPLLDQVDSEIFAAHRRSIVELTFGNINLAYDYALKAVRSTARPPAEALANLAHCQILTNRADDASGTLDRLESLYGSRRNDIVNSLRCRVAIAKQQYEVAWGLANLLVRDTIIHTKTKRNALSELLEHTYLPPDDRSDKQRLLDELDLRLAQSTGDAFDEYWDIAP